MCVCVTNKTLSILSKLQTNLFKINLSENVQTYRMQKFNPRLQTPHGLPPRNTSAEDLSLDLINDTRGAHSNEFIHVFSNQTKMVRE